MPDWLKMFTNLTTSLIQMTQDIKCPKSVLVISGHWEEDSFAIITLANPPMLYDYYGFLPKTYEIVYPAPGMPR
jgi:aromatic ring-opening dioxygenase catalytic subunit (LigB family)